ncbi:MAG: zeta toxin family protein [Lautropia sp.]
MTDSEADPPSASRIAVEPIRRQVFDAPDRQAVHDAAIRAVQQDPAGFIERYAALPRSFGGRYVCADLFKELFEPFAASADGRNRYNTPVHNPAAVLASAQFHRNLDTAPQPNEMVVLLTGVPGSGKTTSVLGNGMPPDTRMVYEGQLARPETTFPKIDAILAAGYRPLIRVVHVPSDRALLRTLQRFHDEGRGASIQTMASIQGALPDGLASVRDRYGDRVELSIRDERDTGAMRIIYGWRQLDVLRSEGTREQIEQRLETIVDQLAEQRRIPDTAWRHARGLAPRPVDQPRNATTDRVGSEVRRNVSTNDARPRVPGRNPSQDAAVKRDDDKSGPDR